MSLYVTQIYEKLGAPGCSLVLLTTVC